MTGKQIECKPLKQGENGEKTKEMQLNEFDLLSKSKKIANHTNGKIYENFGRKKDMWDSL